MIRFNNDYNRGALESILDGLTEINAASYAGYGEDQWCGRAEAVIKKLIAREDAMIKFVPGATQANIVAIAAALSPVQSVIAADTGHIFLCQVGTKKILRIYKPFIGGQPPVNGLRFSMLFCRSLCDVSYTPLQTPPSSE